jgi:hypothetical protein
MQADAIQKLHAAKLVYLTVDQVTASADEAWNPGKRDAEDWKGLAPHIIAVGQKEPIVLSLRSGTIDAIAKAVLWLMRGFLRMNVAQYVDDLKDGTFERVYPKGIPALVVLGLTPDQEYFLACDHDTITRSPWALILQGIEMFAQGYNEGDIAIAMNAELTSAFPPNGEYKGKLAEAKTPADFDKLVKSHWRQKTQEMKAAYRLPKPAFEAYKNWQLGIEGPQLNGTQLKKLDATNSKGGTATAPTAEYLTEMGSFLLANATGTAGPKPLAQSKMKEAYKLYASDTFKGICAIYALSIKLDVRELDAQLAELEKAGTITHSKTFLDAVTANHTIMAGTPDTK